LDNPVNAIWPSGVRSQPSSEIRNHERYHESIKNLTPADVYHGRARELVTARELVKLQTLERRRRENLGLKVKKEEPIRPAELRESVC
jgi:hypothetical protein